MNQIEKDMLDPVKMVEYELINMVLANYTKFFTAIHFANQRKYDNTYLMIEWVMEEMERSIEYSERHDVSQKCKAYKLLQDLKTFTDKKATYVMAKTWAKLVFEDLSQLAEMEKKFSSARPQESSTFSPSDFLIDNSGQVRTSLTSDKTPKFSSNDLDLLTNGEEKIVEGEGSDAV